MINILLVEDDSTLAIGLKYALENEGFGVEWPTQVKLQQKH